METSLPVVGSSMEPVIDRLRSFAEQDETLLLSGPTGVGKSRLARWCHEQSPRRQEPFESLHLLSVPEELQLGELFGWKRGAFTGAIRDNPGSVARAGSGTLFIDEIDKLSLRAQAALLQFLDEHIYRSLGESGPMHPADVRIIVGTNLDLLAAVRAGRFREDLYYRINVLPVRLPPLDERPDEIALWAKYMLERHHRRRSRGLIELTPAAAERLRRASWPGNLRQLDNIMRRAHALARSPGSSAPLLIDQDHIESALQLEAETRGQEHSSLAHLMELAAHEFVRERERRQADPRFTLSLADAFRGLVLLCSLTPCAATPPPSTAAPAATAAIPSRCRSSDARLLDTGAACGFGTSPSGTDITGRAGNVATSGGGAGLEGGTSSGTSGTASRASPPGGTTTCRVTGTKPDVEYRSQGEIATLLAEGQPLRRKLLGSAIVLAEDDLMPRDEVRAIQKGRGKLDAANDLVRLGDLFIRRGSVVTGKTSVTPAEAQRAGSMHRRSPRHGRATPTWPGGSMRRPIISSRTPLPADTSACHAQRSRAAPSTTSNRSSYTIWTTNTACW